MPHSNYNAVFAVGALKDQVEAAGFLVLQVAP
jgi:hypothetical protein